MELPSLRLTVEKGPKKGETFECKASAVARVGRVIKGNHLAVPLAKPRTRGRRPASRSTAIASKDEKEVVKSYDSVKHPDSKDVEAVKAVEAEKVAVEGDITEKTASAGEREELTKEEEVDLDKMTLGQWFSRMEKVLPLMINDMAEEAIANLRETARRFDEFIEMSSTSQ